MATRSTLRTRVANRTGRSTETNFTAVVNDAFDEFITRCGRLWNFKEMRTTTTLALTTGNYYGSLPSVTLRGFSTSIHHILSVKGYLTTDAETTFPVKLKSATWLDKHFPDRIRTSAVQQAPAFCAREGTRLEVQAPVSDNYTLSLRVALLPLAFASDSTSNPIPSLDEALVRYGMYAIYDSVEAYQQADRSLAIASNLFLEAVLADEKEPGQEFQHDAAQALPLDMGRMFSLSDLQTIYPE